MTKKLCEKCLNEFAREALFGEPTLKLIPSQITETISIKECASHGVLGHT